MNWVENQAPLEKRLNEALSLAQRYREALEFYAKPEHWTIRGVELPSRAVPLTWGNEALADKGTRAREALAGKEGG